MNKFKIISFLILTSFSSFSFAGAAEDRKPSIIDKAISTRSYSSATGHNFTVGGVKAANGQVSADITQRVIVDGSSASVKQKVSIAANDAFYNKTASLAKNLLKGGLYGAAAAVAMKGLLDGVDYVMGEGGKISKPYVSDGQVTSADSFGYRLSYEGLTAPLYFKSKSAACAYYANHRGVELISTGYNFCRIVLPTGTVNSTVISANEVSNPNYVAGSNPPPNAPTPVSDAEIDDAFSNWFKNNPGSVTDPVTTYIYSPKTSTGAPATTPQNNPSFGQQEITDEIMNNYLANRNAELVNGKTAVIQDSTSTQTQSNPDGTTTTTKNNPDGSKTETKTETKTNPETGEVETTVTETVINPDGTRGESKQTETKTETKPNPETSKLPAACEYFAVLCDWIGWTKENPEIEPFDIPEKELQEKQIKKDLISVSAPSCPPDQHFDIQGLPFGISINKNYSMQPICNTLEPLKYVFLLITLCGCGFMILRI